MIVRFKMFSGAYHDLGQSVEVPIGVAHVTVTQISREDQGSALGTLTAGLPALQHAAGMCVPFIPSSE